VALATSVDWPDLPPDEHELPPSLRRLGVDVEIAIWTDPAVDWDRFDLILIRSCWDYHDDLGAWWAWLDRLERGRAGARLRNPPAVVRWNARKTYLRELQARGIPVVPTVWLEGEALGSPAATRDALSAAAASFDQLVAKPAISAGALGTLRLERTALGTPGVARAITEVLPLWRRRAPLLVQPFLPEIASEGEWSLLFFDGAFSHAVLKRPAVGDFRVQERHGGTTAAPAPSEALLSAAHAALDGALSALQASPLLYARVDLVVVDGAPLLMELELIEPALFLERAPAATGKESAVERLARAIAVRAAANRDS